MDVANAPAPKWTQWANSNRLIEIIDVSLRGCAQVMFQNNPLTGLFFRSNVLFCLDQPVLSGLLQPCDQQRLRCWNKHMVASIDE